MVPSGINKEQVVLQLARLEQSLRDIQKYKKDRYALERLVQIGVEEALNIGNHLISGLGLPQPETYRGIFQIMEQHKLISPRLSMELQQFAVFRNRLVHLYWKIDDREFLGQLQKTKVLRQFASQVTKLLRKHKHS